MAIYRLTGNNGTAVDNIVSWLNTNKARTFLEDATIQVETSHAIPNTTYTSYGNTMSIEKGETVFRFAFITNNADNTAVKFADVCKSDYTATYGQASMTGTYFYIQEGNLILCKNGLFITTNVYENGPSATKSVCRVCLTHDGDGNLIMICSNIAPSSGTHTVPYNTAVNVAASPLYSGYTTTVKPAGNFNGTAMSNAVLFGTDTSKELENVFFATVSQQNVDAEQPEAVTLDGKNYITNGRIYIRDE